MATASPPSARDSSAEPNAPFVGATDETLASSAPRFIEVTYAGDTEVPGDGDDADAVDLEQRPGRYDYSAQLAHLAVLASLYYASIVLGAPAVATPGFLALVLGGVVLVALSLLVVPMLPPGTRRAGVLLVDLAWLLTALWLSQGLQHLVLPLIFVIVAAAAWRGERWELAAVLLLVTGGLVGLAALGLSSTSLTMVAVQAVALAATGVAVRLLMRGGSALPGETGGPADTAYEALLQASPDAVFALEPRTFRIRSCNPAAVGRFGDDHSGESLVGRTLEQVIPFRDPAFLATCRERLDRGEAVHAAATSAFGPDGRDQDLLLDLTPSVSSGTGRYIQAIVRVPEQACGSEPEPSAWPDYDFTSHYIPSLTHELNNHLGAIRLSAELAASTGVPPDCAMIQSEVDHCQQVLQTVVTQMLRASRPPVTNVAARPQCDLGQAIENCLLLAQPQILSEGIQFRLSLPSSGLPTVIGNTHEIQEGLVRIILRSARALRERDHPRVLKCHASVHADEVTITFSHGGSGLTWGELAAVNGQTGVVPRGEHRMWSVVREGITRYGGTMSASNSVARGVQFRITLKVADAHGEGSVYEQAN